MKIKKLILTGLAALSAVIPMASCGASTGGDGRLNVVTTIFSEYDWVSNVLGDVKEECNVTYLLSSGVDMHNFQPSVQNIAQISSCDVFVYVGGESDKWVANAIASAKNKDMIALNLMEFLSDSVKEEEAPDGSEDHDHEHEEGEEKEYDEHVWLSLKNAKRVVNKLADVFGEKDSENAQVYKSNASAYVGKLDALDQKYALATAEGKKDTVLFADRFAFRYLLDDYSIKYYAAFPGCSAETEASFETISSLARVVSDLDLRYVLTLEGSDNKIANTVISASGDVTRGILTMDSLQAVTERDISGGKSYLSVMESNLETLKKALN